MLAALAMTTAIDALLVDASPGDASCPGLSRNKRTLEVLLLKYAVPLEIFLFIYLSLL